MTIPVKPLSQIEEKSEVSASDKILILDSVSEEARLAPKSELKGDKGDTGATGATGAKGDKGPKGDTGDSGATIVGATFSGNDLIFAKDNGDYVTLSNAKTTLTGPKGDTGNSSTITVGTTSTGLPGSNASVTNAGTSSAAVLNFTIPQGQVGATGNGIESITHSKSGKVTTVVITETNGDTSSFEILDGKDGNSGAGSGDVVGPEGATDGHLAVYDGVTGKLIKDGGAVPTVRNSKIEIQKNGTKVGDFTLNQASNKTIDISVPTKVSDLSNDSGFITGINSSDVTTALGFTPANSASLGTAATKNTGTSSGNVPVLDANGHLASSTLPGVALTDTFTVSTSSDLTSLSSADQGDIAIVTSENKTYVLSVAPYSTASNWKEILAPTGGVTSVNGQTGAVTVQETLVSGTNIKTINNTSLLGSGDITISGGGSDIVYATQAEYNALLPGAESDGKHYFIYSTSGGGGWQPGVNTIAYFPFSSDALDTTGNNTLTNSGTQDGLGWKFTSASQITTPSGTIGYVNYWIKINSYPLSTAAIGLSSQKGCGYYPYQGNDPQINKKIFVWYDANFGASAVSFEPNTGEWHNISYGYDGTKMIYSIDGVVGTLYNGDGYNYGDTFIVSQGANIVISKLILETTAWTSQEISDYYNQTKGGYGIS